MIPNRDDCHSNSGPGYLDHPWSTCVIVHFHMLHPMALSSPETLYRSELSTHCARGLHSWSTVISTADWTAGHPHVAGHQVERSWPCILRHNRENCEQEPIPSTCEWANYSSIEWVVPRHVRVVTRVCSGSRHIFTELMLHRKPVLVFICIL